jgi:hypothetical protein
LNLIKRFCFHISFFKYFSIVASCPLLYSPFGRSIAGVSGGEYRMISFGGGVIVISIALFVL